MWNKFRQIGKSRRLQGPHVVEGQNANLLQGPFRKEWRNRPKVDVRKPPFPKIRGYIMWFTNSFYNSPNKIDRCLFREIYLVTCNVFRD